MASHYLNSVRNYLHEKLYRLKEEWSRFQRNDLDPEITLEESLDSDLRRLYDQHRHKFEEKDLESHYLAEHNAIIEEYKNRNSQRHEPFQYYSIDEFTHLPEHRYPAPGIEIVPLKYHRGQTVVATDEIPESGFQIHPLIDYLITHKYPQYRKYIVQYCRPLGTTDATFSDFNREQKPSAPLDPIRKEHVLKHVFQRLDATPFLPLHFVDVAFTNPPLHTGTGYHNRHSYRINAHAKYSHPKEYQSKRTSKGYYYNAFLEFSRTIVHRIKQFGLPFDPDRLEHETIAHRLNRFFNEFPTMLFTRNHISDRDGNLKQRPVYAVDDLFGYIERMLTTPLLISARKMSCCIMYGLETIRGSNHYLDRLAKKYKSFFTIDWSQFDQRLPRIITDTFFTDFLERLIVISHGYQPTYEYPTYPDLTPEKMFTRMSNLLHFLHTWFNNMTFLSLDGFAYRRTCAGVSSGQFTTQYLDSYGNLFLLIDGLIEYGFSDHQIDMITLFIMGDDNSGFTQLDIAELEQFIQWFERYALTRYNMVLSTTKSIITMMRNRIETLGYQCNFGNPIRPLGKMVAQLCYPEHGPIDKYMSYRAIGIAYATPFMEHTFYEFCRDIYWTFAPYAAEPNTETFFNIVKFLPGQFKLMDSYFEEIPLTHFPTQREILKKYQFWHGPLSFAPKWNFAHFINAPDVIPSQSETLYEYRIRNKIDRKPIPIFHSTGDLFMYSKV